jgi:hypothetical protein
MPPPSADILFFFNFFVLFSLLASRLRKETKACSSHSQSLKISLVANIGICNQGHVIGPSRAAPMCFHWCSTILGSVITFMKWVELL